MTARLLWPTCNVEHNPKPSTPRGQRRHDKRDEKAKQNAQTTWGTPPPRTYTEKKQRDPSAEKE